MVSDYFSEFGSLVLGGALFLAAAWIFAYWTDKLVGRALLKHGKVDPAVALLVARIWRYSIFVLAAIVVLQELGVEVASLIAALGIFGFAVAIGLRTTSTNFFTGIMLFILKPYKVGEFIEGERVEGVVESMSLFHTVVVTKDGIYVAVPNAAMWARSVRNLSRPRPRCTELDLTVAKEPPFADLQAPIADTLKADAMVSAGFEPLVRVIDVKVKSMTIRAAFWCDVENEREVRKRVSAALRERLTAVGAKVRKIAPARKKKPKRSTAAPPPPGPAADEDG